MKKSSSSGLETRLGTQSFHSNRPTQLWRCIAFDFVLYPVTIFMALFCLPLLVSYRATYWISRVWINIVLWSVRYILRIECHFIPQQARPDSRGRIIAAKHQSAWETLALCYYYPQARCIAKEILFYLPFGWYMYRLGFIPLDRNGGGKALKKMMRQVDERVKQGYDIIIYPEGTRRKVGAKPAYKTGIYGIYRQSHAEVIPVAHDSGHLWAKRPLWRQAGEITVSDTHVIPSGLGKKEFMQTLEERIERACQKIAEAVEGD